MNYVDALKLYGVEAKEIPCIRGSGAPPDTEGAVGCLYMDTYTGDLYKRKDSGWEKLVGMDEIYKSYPTETQNDATEIYTDIGADNVPVKSLAVTVTSGAVPVTFTVKRMGKNLLDKANLKLIYGKTIDTTTGETKTSGSYCVNDGFIQVKPGTKYALSGVTEGKNGYVVNAHFYAANKSYLKLRANATDSTVVFTTPDDCHFVRFTTPQYAHSMYANGAKEGDVGTIKSTFNPQLELGAETPYEAYTGTRHTVTVTALNTPTELSDAVTTKLGVNVFELERLDGITASMSVTYRLDPTLAYEKLKTAIVAAGIN